MLSKVEGSRKQPSPPKHPKTRVLFVRNLVRPFTLNQLKQLLLEFGETVDSEFWIDKIKSKCFVTYATEEDAAKAREALHNLRWPLCNPKILHVDFSTPEEMARQKEPTSPRPAAPATLGSVPDRGGAPFHRTVEVEAPRDTIARDVRLHQRPPSRNDQQLLSHHLGRGDGPLQHLERQPQQPLATTAQQRRLPMREWDRDKLRQETPPPTEGAKASSVSGRGPRADRERPRSPSEKRGRRDKKVAKRKQEEDTPAKLLDDLFRKTKASPCIYWLPLTDEQIAHKEEERKQRRLERERRRQQQQLQEEEERRKRALARELGSKARERDSKRSGSLSPVRRR